MLFSTLLMFSLANCFELCWQMVYCHTWHTVTVFLQSVISDCYMHSASSFEMHVSQFLCTYRIVFFSHLITWKHLMLLVISWSLFCCIIWLLKCYTLWSLLLAMSIITFSDFSTSPQPHHWHAYPLRVMILSLVWGYLYSQHVLFQCNRSC